MPTPSPLKPVLSGQQVREIRIGLGLTQAALATKLGFSGKHLSSQLDKIERGKDGRHLSYAQANLLLAMVGKGYEPVTEVVE